MGIAFQIKMIEHDINIQYDQEITQPLLFVLVLYVPVNSFALLKDTMQYRQ